MFTIFDRYIVREILLPFFLALVILTFILLMPPILDNAQQLIEKGVDAATIARILLTLVPQALSVTIPMGLLYGILMGLGRLSTDREFVALQACGVSIFRALRPIAVLALLAFAVDEYVLLVSLPNANQTFRDITFNVVAAKAESDVKPRTFYQGFPDRVVYVRDVTPAGGWRDVLLADTTRRDQTTVYFAESGRLIIDRERRTVQLILEHATSHTSFASQPEKYDSSAFERLILNLDAESVFKRTTLLKGDNEMTIAELRAEIDKRRAQNSPYAMQLFTIHQKFSIPASCLVLAAIGLALGASNRKDGTLASFALGSGVIFVYYVLLYMARAAANAGRLSPILAPWVVNIVLGMTGAALVVWRAGASGEAVRIPLPRFFTSTPEGDGAPTRRGNRVVVVIRIPQINWPRPNLLDLYIVRRYVSVFALTFCSLIGIFYIATFIDLADKLFRGSTTTGMLLRYFYLQTPQYVYYIIPLAALLSTLVTIGVLTKNSELIVMRACGVSLYRSALPLVVFGLLLSGALYQLQERVLSASNKEARRLEGIIRQWPTQTFSQLSRRWIVAQDGAIYYYEYFDPTSNQFSRFSLFRPDPSAWRLSAVTYANQVSYTQRAGETVWVARQGWDRTFAPAAGNVDGSVARDESGPAVNYQVFAEKTLPIEAPKYFKDDQPEAERMTFGELQNYIAQLQKSGYYSVKYQVSLHRKIAFPAVTLVMTLLAIPFAVTTGRSGALYGVGIGISLAIVYWTTQSIFGAMGSAALVPPLLAAWAPNILFGAAAAYMLLTVRT